MKIVCGNCGAKYSIADEKVQGKVFKIRCRKCSHVIVVKGTSEAEADSGGYNDVQGAAEWYAVIDGDQVGPVTREEIEGYFTAGRLDADSYIWREGLAEWVALNTLGEFAHLVADSAGPEEATQVADSANFMRAGNGAGAMDDLAAAAAMGADAGGGMAMMDSGGGMSFDSGGGGSFESFGGGGGFDDFGGSMAEEDGETREVGSLDMGGNGGLDDFGSGSSIESGGSFDDFGSSSSGPSLSSAEDGGGMFSAFDSGGGGASADFESFSGIGDGGGGGAQAAAGGNATDAENLIGKRNENSVLFSLSSLDQISAVSSSDSGPSGGEEEVATEGSGLIDIRSLAASHAEMNKPGSGPGSANEHFGPSTMAVPAVMPQVRRGTYRDNKLLIAGGVVGALVLLGLMGAVGYLITKEDKGGQTVVEKVIVKEKTIVESGSSKDDLKKAAADAAAAEKAALAAADENTEEDEGTEEDDDGKKSTSKKRRRRRRRSSSKPSSSETKKDPPKKTTAKKRKGSQDEIDALLNKGSKKKETKKSNSRSNLPSTPSRGDVKNTIGRYLGRVDRCAKGNNSKGLKGYDKVRFLVRPNGRTKSVATVSGNFKGTDVGKCVEGVVRSMKFPESQKGIPSPGVTFPFKIK